MNFTEAMEQVKQGHAVARGVWSTLSALVMVRPDSVALLTDKRSTWVLHMYAEVEPFVGRVDRANGVVSVYLPTQDDMNASDWQRLGAAKDRKP